MQKQPFLVGGGSEKFEDWGGGRLKNFRTAGGGGHYSITLIWIFSIDLSIRVVTQSTTASR